MNETAAAPAKRAVRFLTREFDAFAERLGADSNVKRARLVGCGIATMSRVRAGKQNPGQQFIAKVHAAAKQHGADGGDFFDFHGTDA